MRLSRTDVFPVLAIIAGGAVGVFTSGALLLSSPSGDVLAPDPEAAPPPQIEDVNPTPPRVEPEAEKGPIFTPMTLRPELVNRRAVIQALVREYPAALRDAGVGGQVVVWFFISETGQVLDRRISRSSGHAELDEAALKIADVYEFSAALNRDQAVKVWIQLPIRFQVAN